MPQAISIDNFIDAHGGNEKIEFCGKLAIARAILQAERKSLLYVDRQRYNDHPNYERLSTTWFNSFMQLLTENCTISEVEKRLSSIALIVFNYDRCVEQFLYHSLQTYYQIDDRRASELVNRIEIYHPYGVVGPLPWQTTNALGRVDFGAEPSGDLLLSLASQIRTFTEGMDTNSSEISMIHQKISQASILVFLGFAFHRLNLKLLTPNASSIPAGKPVKYEYFGTALGISDNDCELIRVDLMKMKGSKPSKANLRNDLDCKSLFKEYWRSLSLS